VKVQTPSVAAPTTPPPTGPCLGSPCGGAWETGFWRDWQASVYTNAGALTVPVTIHQGYIEFPETCSTAPKTTYVALPGGIWQFGGDAAAWNCPADAQNPDADTYRVLFSALQGASHWELVGDPATPQLLVLSGGGVAVTFAPTP
jgi:hypothetical protein